MIRFSTYPSRLRMIALYFLTFSFQPLYGSTFSRIPDIKVEDSDWGEVSIEEIHKVLISTANQILPYTKRVNWKPILIKRSNNGPMVLFERGKNDEYIVLLNTNGRYWCQYAFQFAHEIGHILCGYHQENKRHLWYEEAVCEVASLFALRKMTKAWSEYPPYPHLITYAPEFQKYADKRMGVDDTTDAFNFPEWYQKNRNALEQEPTNFDRNLIVASRLLPIFEKNPMLWDACNMLSFPEQNMVSFEEYLQKWKARSKLSANLQSIREIEVLFGF